MTTYETDTTSWKKARKGQLLLRVNEKQNFPIAGLVRSTVNKVGFCPIVLFNNVQQQ